MKQPSCAISLDHVLHRVRYLDLMATGTDDPDEPSHRRRSRLSADLRRLEKCMKNPDHLDFDATTLRNLQISAKQGDRSVQVALGLWYYVRKEYREARHFLEAARSSIVLGRGSLGPRSYRAITSLGNLYHEGYGGPVDKRKAFHLYLEAAEAGDDEGQYKVAVMYLNGVNDVIKKDYEKAILWFERGACESAGSPEMTAFRKDTLKSDNRKSLFQIDSMKSLFRLYLTRDTKLGCHPVKALVTLFEAAKYCPEAQTWLGAYLCVGPGQFADRRKAKIWLEKAARAENHTQCLAVSL